MSQISIKKLKLWVILIGQPEPKAKFLRAKNINPYKFQINVPYFSCVGLKSHALQLDSLHKYGNIKLFLVAWAAWPSPLACRFHSLSLEMQVSVTSALEKKNNNNNNNHLKIKNMRAVIQ